MRSTSTVFTLLLAASAAFAAPQGRRSDDATESDLPPDVPANTRVGSKALVNSLMLAPTQRERVKLLNQPGDFKFDFMNPPADAISQGDGGHTVSADSLRFPALIGNGAAMTIGFLGPCGFNTPHVHPRSTELNLVIEGRLVTDFIQENGVDPVQNLVNKFQMTVFPQGAVHAEFNPDCEPTTFVAGFGNADPGVQQSAQALFGLRSDMVQATLGVEAISGADIETFRDVIPANVANGVDSCLKKCGIQRKPKRDLSASA